MRSVQRERGFDRRVLAREPRVVDAGAAPRPARRGTPVERRIDGAGRGRVANAHFPWGEQIDAPIDRLHPIGEGRGGLGLGHRRLLRKIARRVLQRELEDFQTEAEALAELVYRRASAREVLDHLPRDLGREGRYALGDDAVIAREDSNERAFDRGLRPTLPGGQKLDDLLKPAQRAGRLRQLRVARARCRRRLARRRREAGKEHADFFEGNDLSRHGVALQQGIARQGVLVNARSLFAGMELEEEFCADLSARGRGESERDAGEHVVAKSLLGATDRRTAEASIETERLVIVG